MQIYQGVIEDIEDPLKMGRVRVRVFGLHTDDRSLIPVSALPWAIVDMPTTSASMSGIGTNHRLLCGSWVWLVFQDADCQYPIVLGSFHGLPEDPTGQIAADEDVEFTDSEAPTEQNTLKDSSGNTVKDSSGAPIKLEQPKTTTETVKPSAVNAKVIPADLGSVSAKYESNGNPGTINSYASGSDLGGASYGAYQFASYLKGPNTPTRTSVTASMIANSPVNQYLRSSEYASRFAGLSPATSEFDAMWKQTAQADSAAFKASQHKYIERTYYQIAVAKLPANITDRGKAIHEAIWSMSVQLGPGGAASAIKSILGYPEKTVCDDKLIDILYTDRIKTISVTFKSSPALWAGLEARFASEKKALMALAKTYETASVCGVAEVKQEEKIVYKEDSKKETETFTKPVAEVPAVVKREKGVRGFSDPSGKYPLYYKEPDTNRLARGIITGTIVENKRANVQSNKEAGATFITEPPTQYNTKYPFNQVTQTESGHIIEYDDTPKYERINIHHKSGSFIEMHPNGDIVTKVRNNSYLIVNADTNTVTLGNQNAHIAGDGNTTVTGNLTLIVYGNLVANVSGNSTTTVTGNASIKANRIDLN